MSSTSVAHLLKERTKEAISFAVSRGDTELSAGHSTRHMIIQFLVKQLVAGATGERRQKANAQFCRISGGLWISTNRADLSVWGQGNSKYLNDFRISISKGCAFFLGHGFRISVISAFCVLLFHAQVAASFTRLASDGHEMLLHIAEVARAAQPGQVVGDDILFFQVGCSDMLSQLTLGHLQVC